MSHAIPDALPVISKGSHKSPAEGACVMEYVSMLAGEEFSDHPECTHRALARVAQNVNDGLPDERRHEMFSRINRLFGTNSAVGEEAKRISAGLAKFSAERAKRSAADAACAAGCAAYTAAAADVIDAAYAAGAAAGAAAAYAAGCAAYTAAAADVTDAAYAAGAAAGAAAGCAVTAAGVGGVDRANAMLQFLDELLDEYGRLTGRTDVKDVACRLPELAAA